MRVHVHVHVHVHVRVRVRVRVHAHVHTHTCKHMPRGPRCRGRRVQTHQPRTMRAQVEGGDYTYDGHSTD